MPWRFPWPVQAFFKHRRRYASLPFEIPGSWCTTIPSKEFLSLFYCRHASHTLCLLQGNALSLQGAGDN